MPFLLGAFGLVAQSLQGNRLVAVAAQYAKDGNLYTMTVDKGIVYAGFKHDEDYTLDKIISLTNNQGIFVGKIFDRQSYSPAVFNPLETQELVNNPKILLKNWWGRYIGVLYNKRIQTCTLIRDPQGLSTLFYIMRPDGVIFSTDLSCLYDFLEEKPLVNLTYFAEYVLGENYASALTPFNNIQELLPGMGLHIKSNGTCSYEQLWDLSQCKGSFISNEKEFEEELLFTLKSSIKAWVRDSAGICLELSGGLDSSGVMILLRDILPEDKKIIGVNYIDSKTPSSNEIEYAQEVANMCNANLHFVDWQNSSLLDPLPESWRPDKPTTFILFHRTGRQLVDLAIEYNCLEIMNGQGGDHVFLAPQPKNSIADYWLDKGLKGISHYFKELSSANRMPWWMLMNETIKHIAQYYGKKEKASYTHKDTAFLDPSFMYNPVYEFYLNESIKNFYPGKKNHIKALFDAVAYADRNQRISGHTITHPLLSQPIVELGLRIPTYQSFNNGFDRIFFRKSVSSIKNPQALWRTIKGETTSSMAKSFAYHAFDVHDILLQGRLVKDGLVNQTWLNEQIVKVRHSQVDNLWPVIRLLTSQIWLNQWKL